MKTALIAVFLGLGMIGCAAGEDDPQPVPEALPEQRQPPSQALSGQLQNPVGMQLGNIESVSGLDSVPAKQKPPIPEPMLEPSK
ncbi:MAG: hypothetical protein JST00_15195 [Deltaproteobacteria bacterium]|nr:hypothetical protein [Deltaproteobacteria bacterium]